MLWNIALRLRGNAVRDGKSRPEKGLLAANVVAYLLDYIRGPAGPVVYQPANEQRGDAHEQCEPADNNEFHAHRSGPEFALHA
jgi:hypothetical protein